MNNVKKFSKLRFDNKKLLQLGLPDIEYPIPTDNLYLVIKNQGQIFLEVLIYWMMDYISSDPDDLDTYEFNLLKIAEKFANITGSSEYTYRSKVFINKSEDSYKHHLSKWSIRLGNVDLSRPVVTIQNKRNKNLIIAAFAYYYETYNLKACLYTAPNLGVIEYLRTYGKDNLTDVRKFNSFRELENSTKKWTAFYTKDNYYDYLCNWQYGLGYKSPDYFDDLYYNYLNLNPIPSDWVMFFIKVIETVESNQNHRDLVGLSKLK